MHLNWFQYVVESTTEYNYPASKRKKVVNHKGEITYDSNNDKAKKKLEDRAVEKVASQVAAVSNQ